MNGSMPPIPERTFRARLARKIRLARFALGWEWLWAALWPAPLIVGIFLAFALLDIPQMVGGWAHLVILVLFAAALSGAMFAAGRRFRWPGDREAERRVERASGLRHRPLAVLDDRPVAVSSEGRALWMLHQRRVAGTLRTLRVGIPRSALPRLDPWALRAAVLLAVVVGLGVAGDRAGDRVARAFQPALQTGPVVPTTIDLWVEPPDYTGLPPVYASAERPSLTFPSGSKVAARVGGGSASPTLAIDDTQTPFEAAGQDSFAVEAKVSAGQRLSIVRKEETLASWALDVVPDDPPRVGLPRPPAATHRQALRIDYKADDDYGLAALAAELRRVDEAGAVVDGTPFELPIPAPGLRVKEAKGSIYTDLTAHAWAGDEVEIRVVATDGADQRGMSEPVRVRLPERVFMHPVARLIIETRKRLADDRQARNDVARRLDAIGRMGDMFGDDTVVHLGLATAKWRLRRDQDAAAVDAVRDLLWDTALRLEDGDLTIAERELRDAQQALMDALQRNAPQEEIDKALNRLWAAIQKFLDTMMAQARDQPPLTPEQMRQMQSVEAQDLREMLQRMRELSQSGAKDAAMQMLAQLQNMLENLRNARAMGQNAETAQQMMQMMRELQEMTERQRGLLDQTFRDAQQGRTPGQPMPGQSQPGQSQPGQSQPGQAQQGQNGQRGDPSGLSGQQEQLRRMLGDLMRRFGEQAGDIPNAFGRAERAMRDAIESLDRGDTGQAVEPQSEALDQLQQAGRSMMEEMARQMGLGEPGREQAGETEPRLDPLGRPPGGRGADSRDIVIPGESDMQRARDIRDELYRRSGDRVRPRYERDYIDRLLERF